MLQAKTTLLSTINDTLLPDVFTSISRTIFLEMLITKRILFKGVHEIMMFHVSLVERIEVQNYC